MSAVHNKVNKQATESIAAKQEEKKENNPYKKERTKLISKELLSEEEILRRGISKDDVSAYRMKKYKEAFTLDKWIHIKALETFTFSTKFVSVTTSEANSFLIYCRYTQSQLRKKAPDMRSKTIDDYNENKDKIDADIQSLINKMNKEIDDAKWNECGFFAKFNSRSPKDVHEYEGNEEYVTNLFFPEMDKFKAKVNGGIVEINEAIIAAYVARAKLLKMHSGQDVIDTFSRSFRSLEDVAGTLRLGDEHMDICIALRKWNDAVPRNGHGEFRCFVHNKKLNAVTQYISCVWFKGLERQKNEIKQRILEFYNSKIKDYVPMDSFVIDFLMLGIELDDEHNVYDIDVDEKKEVVDDIFIIELNPFYKSAGAGLFDWRVDRELFLNGPCEIRVRNELDPKGAAYFHPSWAKSYETYTGISLRSESTKVESKKKNNANNEKKRNCVVL